jgi:hypothetical protein
MPKQQRKPLQSDKVHENRVPTSDRLRARGLRVDYDRELDYVPKQFKEDAEAEKVRRRAQDKDFSHSVSEAAKLLGCPEGMPRSFLWRHKKEFPAYYRRGPHNKRCRCWW